MFRNLMLPGRTFPPGKTLMDPVPSYLQVPYHTAFIVQPFLPAQPHGLPLHIGLGQLDEQMIMAGLTLHETTVELSQIVVAQSLAQPFEPLATPGLYQGKNEQLVQEPLFISASFLLKLHELVHILILPLPSQRQLSFAKLGQDQAKMTPFFRYDGGEVLH